MTPPRLAFQRLQGGRTAVVLLHGVGGAAAIWAGAAGAAGGGQAGGQVGGRVGEHAGGHTGKHTGGHTGGTLRSLAEAGFDAIALDLPGYGASPPLADFQGPHGETGLARMARAALQTLQSLGHDKAWWCGHSMGGMVAQELASTSARAVQGLVLACTTAAFGKPDGAWQQAFLRERLAPLDAGHSMAELARTLVAGMVAPGADAAAISVASAVMARVPEATYRASLAALVGFDRRAALAQWPMPLLCLAGEFDRNAPPLVMQGMAQRAVGSPLARYHCIADAGHLANVEQPQAFDAALIDFLKTAAGSVAADASDASSGSSASVQTDASAASAASPASSAQAIVSTPATTHPLPGA